MSIKYLCYDCNEIFRLNGFDAVNEVGRKYCERCGNNEDDLVVVDGDEYDIVKATEERK